MHPNIAEINKKGRSENYQACLHQSKWLAWLGEFRTACMTVAV